MATQSAISNLQSVISNLPGVASPHLARYTCSLIREVQAEACPLRSLRQPGYFEVCSVVVWPRRDGTRQVASGLNSGPGCRKGRRPQFGTPLWAR